MDTRGVFILFIVFYLLVIVMTSVRLGLRKKRQQLWWDDLGAFVTLIMLGIIAGLYIAQTVRTRQSYGPDVENFFVWANYLTSPTAVWGARLAIVLTLIRHIPPSTSRKTALGSIVVMGLMYLTSIFLASFECGVPVSASARCPYSARNTIINLTFYIASTIWIVLFPIALLIQYKAASAHRKFIICCTVAGLWIIAVDIAHAVNLFAFDKFRRRIVTEFDVNAITATGNLHILFPIIASNAVAFIAPLNLFAVSSQPSDNESVDSTAKA
ncbi:hypothetical protein FA15DRAFT_676440 [Coprinopsis marcescibilis]|uniref:Rhodopsin domain-containing protein n=1 Tax=Coprinopsis marcescibilis TaxID=230819 RepID=A0A5C3KA45_COPMA|nr:hypothetical protein FA15DRAFT_676440 [Coprinopsis marcescibilis]